jgi:predicted dehydrogenase
MNEMIRVAILGIGVRGVELLRAFDGLSGCIVAGAADPNLSRLLYVQEWFPHVAVTAVDGTVLNDPAVKVIVVAAPLEVRPALAAAALEAGKHVLVNGRLAAEGERAAKLVSLAADRGKVLAASHELVYHPAVQEMKTILELGRVGELCYLESARQRPAEPAHEPDAIWSLTALDVAVALYLAGPAKPVRVTAMGRDFSQAGRMDVAFISVEYEGGRFSQHHVSTLSPQRSHRCQVVGREGAMVFNEERTAEVLRVYTAAGLLGSQGATKVATAVMEYDLNDLVYAGQESAIPLVRQCTAFLEAVRGGRPVAADGALGREVVNVLGAAERSVRGGGAAVALG